MDSVKDVDAATAVKSARTPDEHPYLSDGTLNVHGQGHCVRCGLLAIAPCHQNPLDNPEAADKYRAAVEQQERLKAEMGVQMWEAAGKPKLRQGGLASAQPSAVEDARQKVLLKLAAVACGESQMDPVALEAARAFLNSTY